MDIAAGVKSPSAVIIALDIVQLFERVVVKDFNEIFVQHIGFGGLEQFFGCPVKINDPEILVQHRDGVWRRRDN